MASARPPQVHLLSNGSYHLMVSSAGGGYSRWRGLALTRWREDVSCDNWGAFCYIRDPAGGHVWSTTTQPTLQQADSYEAVFSPGRATFRRLAEDLGFDKQLLERRMGRVGGARHEHDFRVCLLYTSDAADE